MEYLVVVFVVLVFLILFLEKKQSTYTYTKHKALFTPAERSFYGVLIQAVGDDVQVFGKVRVADVLKPDCVSSEKRLRAFNKISSKHFDFVLCSKRDLSVLCVVELDDRSHNSPKRRKRDAFLDAACKSAGLRLVHIPAKSKYSHAAISQALELHSLG